MTSPPGRTPPRARGPLGLLLLLPLLANANTPVPADLTPIVCDDCAEWNQPQTPFRIHGNTYFVGTKGLSSVLIDTGKGLILLDGAIPQSVEQITAHLKTLGFDISQVKWILNSHAHFDHAGGIAALQRLSGAKVAASTKGAKALRLGKSSPDDPQAEIHVDYPAVREVTPLPHGGKIKLGEVVVTEHDTPGHTPGSTTWSWKSCEDKQCLDIVYADSVTPYAGPRFRFSDEPARVKRFREGISRIRALPCDIMISTHPSASRVLEQYAASATEGSKAFIAPGACRAYADRADKLLTERLEKETQKK